MKKSLLASLLAVVAVLGLATTFIPAVSAEEPESENIRGYLYLSPSSFHLATIQPGESYTQTLTASNGGKEDLSFTISAETMQADGEDYNMIWGAAPSQYNKIINWVTFDTGTRYTLAPEESTEIKYTIDVPADAAGGAQYLMLVAQIEKTTVDTGVWSVQSALGIQVYSNVDGAVLLQGRVINQDISGFSFEPVIKTAASVENTGNIDFEAKYRTEITNYFSGKTAWTDEQTKLVLPDTKRVVRQDWTGAPQLGLFRVTSTVELPNATTATKTRVVLLFPLWLLILLIVGIVLLVVGIIYRIKRGRAHRSLSH
jgi:hypothetical protein